MVKTKNREITDSFLFDIDSYRKEKHKYEPSNIYEMPIKWDRAENFNVFDDKGNKWIDTTSGIFVTNAGHSNPKIKDAIKKQLIKLWAKKHDKKYIIVFKGSYHGRVLGSDLLGGDSESTDWSNMTDNDIVFLDFPYENQELDLKKLPPLNEIAGFFLETYQGWGAWFYPQKYIDKLYQLSRENNILFCFDEVQSGFYRMGTLYGYQTYGDYKPDIITLGKGLTSSLPLSAVLSRKEIIDCDSSANLSSTHAGNTLCCAAGLGNLEFLNEESFQINLKEKCEYFEEKCNSLLKYNVVSKVNVRGLICGIILKDKKITSGIVKKCIMDGILMMDTKRESIKLGPPLTITIDALKEVFEVLEKNIGEVDEFYI